MCFSSLSNEHARGCQKLVDVHICASLWSPTDQMGRAVQQAGLDLLVEASGVRRSSLIEAQLQHSSISESEEETAFLVPNKSLVCCSLL